MFDCYPRSIVGYLLTVFRMCLFVERKEITFYHFIIDGGADSSERMPVCGTGLLFVPLVN